MLPTSLLEKAIIEEFRRSGWLMSLDLEARIYLENHKLYIPDIALLDNNRELIAIVEIMVKKENLLPSKIQMLEIVIKSSKVPVIIIATGNVYDIYIEGEFITQTAICPTLETCQLLLKTIHSLKGGEH